MKRLALAVLLLPSLALAEAATWNIDPSHTQATFTVRHMVISNVKGEFQSTKGVVKIDDKDLAKSMVDVTIDAASIHTREDKRDAHLRSPDFFDVERYPTITFKSTKVEKAGGDRYKVTGDLTMHGVTKPVVLDAALTPEVKGMMGEVRRGAQATTRVNRQEYGLKWNKMLEAGPLVGDDVAIEINAELIKAPADGKTARN
ncbi:MAG TPA: YceI family protein [Anaeromyxobacter sp.]|jgi:polyisoprenoid-binding protein YceI|nr:YceI family protein [Anaeromyxobacter sp.]